MKNNVNSLSNAEFAEARKFEQAGLTTISQAVKQMTWANEGDEDAAKKVREWRKALANK